MRFTGKRVNITRINRRHFCCAHLAVCEMCHMWEQLHTIKILMAMNLSQRRKEQHRCHKRLVSIGLRIAILRARLRRSGPWRLLNDIHIWHSTILHQSDSFIDVTYLRLCRVNPQQNERKVVSWRWNVTDTENILTFMFRRLASTIKSQLTGTSAK